ncbi:unnamed protein product [Closterium sp. NIES-53]
MWRLAETVDWPPEAPLGTWRKRPSEARWAAQPDLLVQTALRRTRRPLHLEEGGRPRTCSRSGTKYSRGREAPPEPAGTTPAPPASAPTPAAPPVPVPPAAPAPAGPPADTPASALVPLVAPTPAAPPAPAPGAPAGPAAPVPPVRAPPGPVAPAPPAEVETPVPAPAAPPAPAPPVAAEPPPPAAPPAPSARLQQQANQASVRRPKQRWVACRPPHCSPVRSPVRRT